MVGMPWTAFAMIPAPVTIMSTQPTMLHRSYPGPALARQTGAGRRSPAVRTPLYKDFVPHLTNAIKAATEQANT
jgi:hypothetical protein